MKHLLLLAALMLPALSFANSVLYTDGFPYPTIVSRFTNDLDLKGFKTLANDSLVFSLESGDVKSRLLMVWPDTVLAYSNDLLIYSYTINRRTKEISRLKVVEKTLDRWN